MMLQTIILLALLFVALVLGMWMAFFGRRSFRLSGALFGFGVGVAGMLFAAWQMDIAFNSMIVLIGTPLLGLGLGLLGAFVPIAGSGLGGICMGFFYGVGIVFTADALLNGAIDEFLYTAISIALVAIAFILCLIWHESAKWMTTAFVGSYVAAFAVTLAFIWFMSGGFSTTEPSLAGNFIDKYNGLNGLMTPTTKMVMLGASLLVGVVGGVIQVRSKSKKENYTLLDELDELDEQENDDLFPLDEEQEEPVRKRRGLFGRNKSIDDLEEEEIEDEPDLFDDDLPKPKKERRRGRQPELLEEETVAPAAPPRRAPQSQVAVVEQTAPEAKPKEELGKTQVFKRIKEDAAADKPIEPSQPRTQASQPAQRRPQAAQPRSQEQKTTSMQEPVQSEPRMPKAPSFTPRSQRRK